MGPEISIIIPTHRGGIRLFELLQSIKKQAEAPTHEVLVVANPPNECVEMLCKNASAQYFSTEKIGANSARNIGVARASGSIFLFLDDDCFLQDSFFLKKHLDLHKKNPELAGLGGPYEKRAAPTLTEEAYHFQQEIWLREGLRPGFFADLLFGGNMSFKKNSIKDTLFDPDLVYGGTETDFIFRLAKKSAKIRMFDSLKVEHHPRLSPLIFLKKAFLQGRGAARLFKNHYWGNSLSQPRQNMIAPRKLFLFIWAYTVFFEVGFSYEKNARKNLSVIYLPFIFLIELFRPMIRSMKNYIFIDLWFFLESTIIAGKKKPNENPRTKNQ